MMNPANLLMAACAGVAVIVGLLTALAITLYLKLQGDSTAPLALMLLPLWIIESALLVALYGFLVSGLRKGADAQGLSGTAGTCPAHPSYSMGRPPRITDGRRGADIAIRRHLRAPLHSRGH